MSKTSSQYCVVYNSSTVGQKSYLADRFAKREDADREAKSRNRGAGMGGFFSVHECAKLGWETKRAFGLLPADTVHHVKKSAKRARHHASKKSPAQLDREIAEVLGPYPYDDPQLAERWRISPSELRIGQRFDHFGKTFEVTKIGRDKARTIQIARRYSTPSGKDEFIDHRSFPMRAFYQQHLLPIRS